MAFRLVTHYGRNLMRQVILTLLRPFAVCRKQWWSTIGLQFTFGVLVGALLGFYARFNYSAESNTIKQSVQAGRVTSSAVVGLNSSSPSSVSRIRCVIFIHPKQKRKANYVEALRDTYTQQCNDTIYVTNSREIREQFREMIHIAFVRTKKTQYHWDLYRQILKYSLKHNLYEKPTWTVVGDEQTFIVMTNLRRILALHDPGQPLILGRMSTNRSLISYIFPLGSHTAIHLQGGVVFSNKALERMTDDACFGLLSPTATERALVRCSNRMNVQLLDPTDQEGMHLFNSKDLDTLITSSNPLPSKNRKQRAQCCSDRAASFGGMNYRQHRMVHFAVTRIKVFGYQKLQSR